MSTYGLSLEGSYTILYVVMVGFTVLALTASSYIPVPEVLRSYLVASNGKTTVASGDQSGDFFLSARNSASAKTVAMSFFAGGMGAWVVYATAEMGANPQLSWLGMIGYSGASAFPAVMIAIIGPKVRKRSGEKAFNAIDFAYQRYGRLMQLCVSAVSVFYMLIYIVAELTSISNVYALLVDKITFDGANMDYTTHIAITMCVFTVFYTSVGGVPASIVTDKFQAVVVLSLVFVLFFAVVAEPENRVTATQYRAASSATVEGFMALVTLFIAILCAELFNQATWQRVWAAESPAALRRGYLYATVPIFLVMMFFGVMGQIAYAKDASSYDNFTKLAYLSFFDLLVPLQTGWHVLVLILITAFAASSIDSLQTGMVGIFNRDILRFGGGHGTCSKWVSRALLVAINVPAVYMSTKRFDVVPLFLVADLVCATTVLPLFLGLMAPENWSSGIIKAPTELGAVLGSVAGVCTVLVNAAILDFTEARNPYTGELYEKGLFAYFWLTNGDICALCGPKTMVTFIVTPLSAGFFALLFSALDIMVRGEEVARRPLLYPCLGVNSGGDDEDEEVVNEKNVEMEENAVEKVEA
jgi:Na+/proline symporter